MSRELEAGTDTNIQQRLFLHKILSKTIINGVKLERKSRGEKKSKKREEVYIGSNNEVRSKRIDLCVFLCCTRAESAKTAAAKDETDKKHKKQRERQSWECMQ